MSTAVGDDIVITGNVAIQTLRHPLETTVWVNGFAAFLIEVPVATLAGNVAAGSADTGFMIRPSLEACEMMNEAVACMTGFFILRASSVGCDSSELNGVRADCDSSGSGFLSTFWASDGRGG
ncbi:unnamed protein product [Prorocentrum cordatum]|uniref:Uncharacterized protein n=1 Tax=Prorocentrum cordatum TaxID=2364126 RepID=A0ABN9VI68_9DINO|nr:unnamed protein product [Polarella glacialis]